jgi:hypothetical protein
MKRFLFAALLIASPVFAADAPPAPPTDLELKVSREAQKAAADRRRMDYIKAVRDGISAVPASPAPIIVR